MEKGSLEDMKLKATQLVCQIAADKGMVFSADRIKITLSEDLIRATMLLATKEEEVFEYPANWWEMLKQALIPKWLLKYMPIRFNKVVAVHKYPEVVVPPGLLGREFIHVKVIPWEDLVKLEA